MTPLADFSVGSAVIAAGEVFTSALSILTSNPIFVVFIGAALIPVGMRIFKAAKGAAK